MAKSKSEHYINNEELFDLVIKYKTEFYAAVSIGKPRPKMSDELGIAIMTIAQRLALKPNFSGYTYKEDMMSDGVEKCVNYLHNFNPEKSKNAFAYITQIIYYAFLQRIDREKKQAEIKYKCIEEAGYSGLYGSNIEGEDGQEQYRSFLDSLQSSNKIVSKSEDNSPKLKEAKQKKVKQSSSIQPLFEENTDPKI